MKHFFTKKLKKYHFTAHLYIKYKVLATTLHPRRYERVHKPE